jgi:type II secretory pathway pseudopilin PulG
MQRSPSSVRPLPSPPPPPSLVLGQQQLLLHVLGIVIVGIALVAALSAFTEGKVKADRDAAYQDAIQFASRVQTWKLKPASLGGGDGASGFTGVTFEALGIVPNNGVRYQTSSGCYRLTGGTNARLRVFLPDCATRIATITIRGTAPDDLRWAHN